MNNWRKNGSLFIGIIFFIAFLLRLLLIPNLGFEADISFWKSWGLAVYDHGIVWAAHNTNNNYPTPFAYILGVMVAVYSFFADPHNFNEFWSNANLLFLTIAKLLPILADFGIAVIFLWIGKHAKKVGFPDVSRYFYLILAAIYLFNPISIIDGAWWGQVDSVGVFIFLLAFVAAATKRPFLAGFIFMAAMMTKLQNMIYGPVFFLFLWELLGYQGLVKAIAGALTGFFALNIEFFLNRDMAKVIASLTDNFDYFPLMSLNAYNLWWIVSDANGMHVSDKLLALGLINAKTMGLLLFSSFYLLAVLFLHITKVRTPDKATGLTRNFLLSLTVAAGAFFLFQTQSHDRYAFPISVFLLLLAPFIAKSIRKLFFTLYAVFSIVYFYNLHTALVANYPLNGIPGLSSLTQPMLTIIASIILIALFVCLIIVIIKNTHVAVYLAPAAFFGLALIGLNIPLVTKKPVSLTKLTPFANLQDYGTRTTDMPVNSGFGINKWSFLSVQYAFYRKGIGTHAASFMNYDIGGHFKRFTTDYGIDTEAGPAGLAIFEIYGDGKLLFASNKIGRFDLPKHAEVNLSGVKTLGLVTRAGKESNFDDHTDWLNPELWP